MSYSKTKSKAIDSKSKQRPGTTSSSSGQYWLIGILVVACVVFSRLVTKFFINIDDDIYIVNNPYIKSLAWGNLVNIFTKAYGGNYHPLTSLFEAVEYKLFALRPAPYHMVSLLFHLLNTYLVFILADKFNKRTDFKLLITAMFAFHPMHVESVAWIADHTDLFYASFFIGGMITYINYITGKGSLNLGLTYFLFVCSILCKPAAIAFPAVLILIDFYFRDDWKSLWKSKIPFFIVSAVFAYVTFFTLHVSNTISKDLMPDYTLVDRFFIANYAFCYYIFQLFLPLNLSALHLASKELSIYYYLAPAGTLAVAYFVFKAKSIRKELIFGMLFYLFTIGLVLQIIPTGYINVAERYSYVPYLGLFFILAFVFEKIAKGDIGNGFWRNNYKLIGIGYVIVFIILSFFRTSDWTSVLKFNKNIADENPNSAYAQLSAAFQEQISGDMAAAENHLNLASELDSSSAQVHSLKAQVYFEEGRFADALNSFRAVQRRNAEFPDIDRFLARTYFSLKQYDSAITYFDKLTLLNPSIENLQDKAASLYLLNRFDSAATTYSAILKMDSINGRAFSERGVCYQKLNKMDLACKDWQRALELGREECREDLMNNCR